MSYYEAQSWQIPAQQAISDQPPPPSRAGRPIKQTFSPQTEAYRHAGTGSALQHEDGTAFDIQIEGMSLSKPSFSFCGGCRVCLFQRSRSRVSSIHWDYNLRWIKTDTLIEVNRALDNLNKSGKLFSPSSRRDSMPMMGGPRAFSDFGTSNIVPDGLEHSNHKLQTLVWAEYPSGTIPLATSIRSALILDPISKTSMQISDTSQDQTKQSRCCKPSAAWPRNVNVNSEITTRSSSTTGVGSTILCYTVAFADDQMLWQTSPHRASPTARSAPTP